MNHDEIIEIQTKVGAEPDGFWGPDSSAKTVAYLRKLVKPGYEWPAQRDVPQFFGPAGKHLIKLDVSGLGVEYDHTPVSSILCHEKVAPSLKECLTELSQKDFGRRILKLYAGCYNNRKMRGGSALSMHAYGIALDFWPAENMNKQHWPTSAEMPLEFMEVFAKRGWTCAGAVWGRDAMHVQATKF